MVINFNCLDIKDLEHRDVQDRNDLMSCKSSQFLRNSIGGLLGILKFKHMGGN